MYKWYALKRILRGILIFCVLMVFCSVIFNTANEKVQYSAINEQVKLETMKLRNVNAAQMEAFRKTRYNQLIKQFKLDRPFGERIIHQSIKSMTLQFGESTLIKSSKGSKDVRTIVFEAVPRTLILFTTATLISLFIGIFLGLKKAQRPGGFMDRSTSIMTMVVYGMPSWWLALMMIMFLVYKIKLFPSGGINSVPSPEGIAFFFDSLWHLTLPVITLVLLGFWGSAFFIRNIVLGVLQEDFIMSARARGVPENKVLFGHTLRTSAPPLVTIVLLSVLGSISGGLLFEGIFSWPGMGNLYWVALQQNDIPVLMGDLTVTIGLYQLGLVFLDLTYGFLDPRIKTGGKA